MGQQVSSKRSKKVRKKSFPNATHPKNGCSSQLKVQKAQLVEYIRDAVVTEVDPEACVPILNTRCIVQSGVRRLMMLFSGAANTEDGPAISGFSSAGELSLVVKIDEDLEEHLRESFKSDGLTEEKINERIASRTTWFGVVDGHHSLLALRKLSELHPNCWDSFKWPVMLLPRGIGPDALRKISRQRNSMHDERCFVATTLFDLLLGMKQEANRIEARTSRKPNPKDVVLAYDGSGLEDKAASTVRSAAVIALKLNSEVIDEMGVIMNEEKAEEASLEINNGSSNYSSLEPLQDSRMFRNFLKISALRLANTFFSKDADIQRHTLHRCKDFCLQNGKSSASTALLNQQAEISSDAVQELNKFHRFAELETFPREFNSILFTLLRTTQLDSKIIANRGNDGVVLDALLSTYQRYFPVLYSQKVEKFNAQCAASVAIELGISGPSGETECTAENGEISGAEKNKTCNSETNATNDSVQDGSGNIENGNLERGDEKNPTGRSPDAQITQIDDTNRQDPTDDAFKSSNNLEASSTCEDPNISPTETSVELESYGVFVNCMEWESYCLNDENGKEKMVDFILTDPPPALLPGKTKSPTSQYDYYDDDDMARFASFAKRALVPGGYVYMFVSFDSLPRWKASMLKTSFDVMDGGCALIREEHCVRKNSLKGFPLNNADIAFVARKQGTHPQRFQPDFNLPFDVDAGCGKRSLASLYQVPGVSKKLLHSDSKRPICSTERNPALLEAMILTYCPSRGCVLDPFGGSGSTAMAAVWTGRNVVLIEREKETYRAASERLLRICVNREMELNVERKRRRSSRQLSMKMKSLTEDMTDDDSSIVDLNSRGVEKAVDNGSETCPSLSEDIVLDVNRE